MRSVRRRFERPERRGGRRSRLERVKQDIAAERGECKSVFSRTLPLSVDIVSAATQQSLPISSIAAAPPPLECDLNKVTRAFMHTISFAEWQPDEALAHGRDRDGGASKSIVEMFRRCSSVRSGNPEHGMENK